MSALPGGLVLARHKSLSNQSPIKVAELPPWLCLPLQQRNGALARAQVEPGDRVLRGSVIAGGSHLLDPPIHASTSGRVIAIEERVTGGAGLLAPATSPCIVFESDGLDAAVPPLPPLDLDASPHADLLARLHTAGIAGLGGAGFPAAAKLNHRLPPIDTLLINGAECEPYITCDDALLRERAGEVLRGAAILHHLLGAHRTLIAIEADMPLAQAAMERALRASGLSGFRVALTPVRYPTGGERQLIQQLTGREVPSGSLPAAIGVICQNVATAAAIHRAVDRGEALDRRIVTVTGRGVRAPQNLEVRLGTPVAWLIAQCGGYAPGAERLLIGGPMMGRALTTDQAPIVKTVNAILVAGPGEFSSDRTPRPCIRCGACAAVCPAQLLPQQLHGHAQARQLGKALDYHLFDCIECGCCDVVCPSHIPLTQHFQAAKQAVTQQQEAQAQAARARRRFEAREVRKAEAQRERERMAQQRKAALGQAASPQIQQALDRARRKRAAQNNPAPGIPPARETTGDDPT